MARPPAGNLFYLQKPFHPYEVRQLALALGQKWQAEGEIQIETPSVRVPGDRFPINDSNLMTLMRGARARWKVENESKTRLWRKLRSRFDLCLIPDWETLYRSIIQPPLLSLQHDTRSQHAFAPVPVDHARTRRELLFILRCG